MKAFLICPAERTEVSALAEDAPLVNLQILGKPFLHHWLEHLADGGMKEVKILATDRPEQVRRSAGDGSRWGLQIEVLPQSQELTCDEVREKFEPDTSTDAIILLDHFPDLPDAKPFSSYANFFSVVKNQFLRNATKSEIGWKEIRPGIWTGPRTHISPRAKLYAPCWIGENVLIEANAHIGPLAFLENGVAIETGAAVKQSWIAPHTFVGSLTHVNESFALGHRLVNFRMNSVTKVPDAFLLCALRDRNLSVPSGNLVGRIVALLVLLFTLPFALITAGLAKAQGNGALRSRRAMSPQIAGNNDSAIVYYEFTNANGWWKRWPQLWNVARGDFAWIGNRPLTSIEAGDLTNEFERLWLATPIGLISQGDAEGCASLYSDEARAHASFYAVSVSWRLDLSIFFRAMKRFLGRKLASPIPEESGELKDLPLGARVR